MGSRTGARIGLLLGLLLGAVGAQGTADVATNQAGASVASPDGRTRVSLDVDENGAPRYAVRRDGRELMPAGFLGMRFQSQPAFDDGFRVGEIATASHDATWEQPCGDRA